MTKADIVNEIAKTTGIEKTARNISKNTTVIIPTHNNPAFKPANTFKEGIAK